MQTISRTHKLSIVLTSLTLSLAMVAGVMLWPRSTRADIVFQPALISQPFTVASGQSVHGCVSNMGDRAFKILIGLVAITLNNKPSFSQAVTVSPHTGTCADFSPSGPIDQFRVSQPKASFGHAAGVQPGDVQGVVVVQGALDSSLVQQLQVSFQVQENGASTLFVPATLNLGVTVNTQ